MTTNGHELQHFAKGVHFASAKQRFYGLEVGTKMSVFELDDGLLLHSPVAITAGSLESLGNIRYALAPNLLHHLYLDTAIRAGAEAWGAPGLKAKRRDLEFAGEIDAPCEPFGRDIFLYPIRSLPMTNEVVLLHRPSRTLVVTDLVFHFTPSAPPMTRAAMRLLGGYPGCKTTALERFQMKRARARIEIEEILSLDFDRLIMAHGEPIERGGKDALRDAFRWLMSRKSDR